jgi:hypothetical protein
MASETTRLSRLAAHWRRLVWPLPRTMLCAGLAALSYGPAWSAGPEVQILSQYVVLYVALSSLADLEFRLAKGRAGGAGGCVPEGRE